MTTVLFLKVYQQKTDGTLAIIIPHSFRTELKIEKGDTLAAYIDNERTKKSLVIVPVPKSRSDTAKVGLK